jgi:hypothetical protein
VSDRGTQACGARGGNQALAREAHSSATRDSGRCGKVTCVRCAAAIERELTGGPRHGGCEADEWARMYLKYNLIRNLIHRRFSPKARFQSSKNLNKTMGR